MRVVADSGRHRPKDRCCPQSPLEFSARHIDDHLSRSAAPGTVENGVDGQTSASVDTPGDAESALVRGKQRATGPIMVHQHTFGVLAATVSTPRSNKWCTNSSPAWELRSTTAGVASTPQRSMNHHVVGVAAPDTESHDWASRGRPGPARRWSSACRTLIMSSTLPTRRSPPLLMAIGALPPAGTKKQPGRRRCQPASQFLCSGNKPRNWVSMIKNERGRTIDHLGNYRFSPATTPAQAVNRTARLRQRRPPGAQQRWPSVAQIPTASALAASTELLMSGEPSAQPTRTGLGRLLPATEHQAIGQRVIGQRLRLAGNPISERLVYQDASRPA